MTTIRLFAALLLQALWACSPTAPQQPDGNDVTQATPAAAANGAENAVENAGENVADDVALPDDRTPLEEPKGPIDPKSAEAAGQVVQQFGALIEQRRFAEANKLWGDSERAGQFALQLKRYPEAHLEIGKPGEMGGAAGSSYVTVPVIFYGADQIGAKFRRAAEVILRRVNDVPGSTAAQRRWHIERIDWTNAT